MGLCFRAHGLDICFKLCPNGWQVKDSALKVLRLRPTLSAACFSACNYLFCFLQVALPDCSLQLIINSPLLHCPTFAPGRLLKFYFIMYSNLMPRAFYLATLIQWRNAHRAALQVRALQQSALCSKVNICEYEAVNAHDEGDQKSLFVNIQ